MKADPILKELWEIKDGLAAECNHDLRLLFDKLQSSQQSRKSRLVNRTKRGLSVGEPEGPGYRPQTRPT